MKEDIYTFSQYVTSDREANVLMAGISYCDASYYIERTDHDAYVMEYTMEGEGVLEVDGQHYTIGAGDTYFLYKGKGHKYYCKSEKWIKLWVVISGRVTEALFQGYLKEQPNVLYGFDILRNMQNILSLVKNRDLSYEEMVDQIMVIVHKILIAAKRYTTRETGNFYRLQEAVKDYIDDNLDKPLKLEKLAEMFHYSKNHIINLFRDRYGVTPYVYYERQKILAGRELLRNTSLTVSDISEKLGFETPQYFSKCFKKYCGVSPLKFRRECR